jgi:general stress protein 26
MTTNPERHLFEIIDRLEVAMLVTHGEGGLHARPLHLVERDDDGTLWFFTSLSSGKIAEIRANPEVALTFQGEHRFVSVSGVARIERDPETAKRLFRESFRPWFPDGPSDPEAVGVGVTPQSAEFWDLAGVRGVRYVFNAVTAVATGRRAFDAPSADYHGLVSFGPDKEL